MIQNECFLVKFISLETKTTFVLLITLFSCSDEHLNELEGSSFSFFEEL